MIDLKKIDYSKLAPFRFKKLGKDYLLTNEAGDYIFLSSDIFRKYIYGKLDEKLSIYQELLSKNFIRKGINTEEYIAKYREKNNYLFSPGPSLHIIVVTLRCNHKCLYCQTSSAGSKAFHLDMDKEIARKTVDLIFKSNNHFLAIEFQGGEPLLNWPIVRYIIEYTLEKNKKEKRDLDLRLVSNFTLMSKEKMDYLFKKGVTFCTSLDGPEKLHNKNRAWLGGNSYQTTIKWLKRLLKEYKKYYIYQPGALTTINRFSFPYWKKIIDEYVKLGLDTIALRPLSSLGMAEKNWKNIGYSPNDFLKFYKKSLNYIFYLNLKKKLRFREMMATNMASKILTEQDANYFELRSPCGATIGQVLYNYDGTIYTCDEGRMLGEETFKIGNVRHSKYEELINHPNTKSICLASCLDNLFCTHCVYKPYCGTCPIINYKESGNIFAQMPNSSRCQIQKGILDFLFQKIKENDKIKIILKRWAVTRHRQKGI